MLCRCNSALLCSFYLFWVVLIELSFHRILVITQSNSPTSKLFKDTGGPQTPILRKIPIFMAKY